MSHDHTWHRALNAYNKIGGEFRHWMYETMNLRNELPRLALLFKKERNGELTKTHRQCSLSPTQEVIDNHLSCCLGIECRKCPHLLALSAENETILDEAKAFTCATHILHELGSGKHIDTSEGYLLTEDDKMFWKQTYESMSK